MKILNELKAEVVLRDTNILTQVENLKGLLTYKTDNKVYDFEDYFHILNKEIQAIERIELLASVPPGGAQSYLVELSMALQMVTDKVEMSQTRAIYFQGKLKSALHVKDNLLATFSAWYLIAIAEKLKEAELKIPASTQKALAESEFSRLLDDVDINIEGLLSAVEVMVTHLKEMRKIAQEKYKLGTDQANASVTNLPFNGLNGGAMEQFPLLKQRWNLTTEEKEPSKPIYTKEDFDDIEDTETSFEIPEGLHRIISANVEEPIVEDEVSAEDLTASIEKFRDKVSGSMTITDDFAGEMKIEDGEVTLIPQKSKKPPIKIEFDDTDDLEEVAKPAVKSSDYDDEDEFVPKKSKKKNKLVYDADDDYSF